MNTRIAIKHSIEQRFDHKVGLSTHWLRLRPAPHTRSLVEAYSLEVHTEPHFLNWLRDPYENHLARLDLPEPVADLRIEVEVLAELPQLNPFDFLVEPHASSYPFNYPEQLVKELAPYLWVPAPGPRLAAWFASLEIAPGYIVERLGDINLKFYNSLPAFGPLKPGAVDPEAVLAQGGGSAWEVAWLATLSLRHLGLAARFTSGYQVALAPGVGGYDIARLHAWTEVYLPGAGWIGLDPAGGIFAAEGHIPLASAPEYLRTLPVMGYHEHCQVQHEEVATVRRLSPAEPAWPYSETQWADIRALGRKVDTDVGAQGIALNLGQSLSFVSAINPGAPEWTNSAMGPDKTRAAEELLQRLKKRLAPGGILHLGQAEWMGGEALPRWRLSAFFRSDGFPIWRDEALIGRRQSGFKPTGEDAARFADELALNLGLSGSFVTPAFEDGLHQFWQHRNSLGSAPDSQDLRDPERRRALAARLTGNDSEPAGYVLPLRWDPVANAWSSGRWSFRRGRLVLIPGDAALGFRLPLDSLPVGDAAAAEPEPERCQFDERPLLPSDFGELARFVSVSPTGEALETADSVAVDTRPPRTALGIQVRQGQIHVFLPPLSHLEHYLALIAAIERSASQAGVSVMLEGYEPPEDHRLRRLTLEPDAGSLKLTLPEVDTSPAQMDLLESAFTEAANTGLRAERIMSDGKSLPPGGRSDIRLGGTAPAESPFFRRPELLRSLIVYWQRHPSLSYLFAGHSIGPGGSAPRPDEGRDDALYELGIALERIPAGECTTPWIPDRLLRHLLADPAGDMRRAEIRVDQLYPPDRSSLRLGRTIVRAFETPPHPRLAAIQGMLVKGLLGFFAARPCREDLVDWGSALHDRFMLPSVLWADFLSVLEDLHSVGLPFQPDWFQPLLELRFPVIGKVPLGDMALEMRAAHEPWPVLAEETTSNGTARFVDSANEKVQVRCSGLTPGRHALVCNGHRVPLKPVSPGQSDMVAGIRFKANEPISSLHPTRRAVDALEIDLVDTWTGYVLGGCTYIPPRPELFGAVAAPPGGAEAGEDPARQHLHTAPVRIPPFSTGGMFISKGGGGSVAIPPASMDERYPYLLDLVRL